MRKEELEKKYILEASYWEKQGNSHGEYTAIANGLKYNQRSYELFYMLGLYWLNVNVNKAFLCFEMSLHYCDHKEDQEIIQESYAYSKTQSGFRVRNVSIAIVSYNDYEILKKCIESIEETMPLGSYEVVVVDNASTDKRVIDYLSEKQRSSIYNFVFVDNKENTGFPKGCNIGVMNSAPSNDIFFLNNDTVLMPNALFWLRMGLYENRSVGATGALSNQAPLQDIKPEVFEQLAGKALGRKWHKDLGLDDSLRLFRQVAERYSIPLIAPYKAAFRLTGFAILLSRSVLNDVSVNDQVFDELYSPGYFEDDDLGIRVARAGFTQYICSNSFIYHDGGSGFAGHNDALDISKDKFIAKWGFDIRDYCDTWDEAIELVNRKHLEMGRPPRVLDVSCGFGINGSKIKFCIEGAYVAGICNTPIEKSIADTILDSTVWGFSEGYSLPWDKGSFDIILIEDPRISNNSLSIMLADNGCILRKDE
jgi:GT2 family glycosyltransferase